MAKILIAGDNLSGEGMWHFFKNHDVSTFSVWEVDDKESTWFNYAIICESPLTKSLSLTRKRNIKDLRCDTTLIEDAIQRNNAGLFIVASNVEPGTVDRIKQQTGQRIVHLCCENKMFVFGGIPSDTKEAVELFASVGGSNHRYLQTDSKTCELFRHTKNTFNTVMQTLTKQMKNICNASNIDFYQMRELWLTEMNIDLNDIDAQDQETIETFAAYVDSIGCNTKILMDLVNT